MNVVQNRRVHPHLRDEEAVVVENAIRLAIDSIVNVLYGVNGGREREHRRTVADKDQEIRRLERRLGEIEHELRLLRQQGCTCGLLDTELGFMGARGSGERSGFEPGAVGPGTVDPETTAAVGPREAEICLSVGLYARPPSQVSSSHSHESALPSSPSRPGLDQTATSQSSEGSGGSDRTRTSPGSGGVMVKEEPCDMDTVLIKWEMSEDRFKDHQDRLKDHQDRLKDHQDRFKDHQESRSSPCPDLHGPRGHENLDLRDGHMFMDRPESDPCEHAVMDGEHLRRRRSVPMAELPEEAQRLKRAAWRAASRRYYARKVARQQVNPPRPPAFPPITHAHYPPPPSLAAGKRKRTLISELPAESQSLQREAWRAASRRYYARKIARHQTEPVPLSHLLQDMDPSGPRQQPEPGGGQLGGILCS